MLLRGRNDPKLLILARAAYENVLREYPRHAVVFDSLMEMALSYLFEYRGDQFDTGVLITAAELIDQAEVYARDSIERQELIIRYRSMIRGWHQDETYKLRGGIATQVRQRKHNFIMMPAFNVIVTATLRMMPDGNAVTFL